MIGYREMEHGLLHDGQTRQRAGANAQSTGSRPKDVGKLARLTKMITELHALLRASTTCSADLSV